MVSRGILLSIPSSVVKPRQTPVCRIPGRFTRKKRRTQTGTIIKNACIEAPAMTHCPRCGSRAKNSTALSLAKFVAIVGSLVGIIFLWGYTKYVHEIPSIRISEIRILLVNVLIKSFNAGKCGSQGPQ